MNQETNFWNAIGHNRIKILNILIAAALVFAVLPILFEEETVMGIYGAVFSFYAFGDSFFALYQLIRRQITAVVFLYRLWHAFFVMLLLVLCFLLGGLAMGLYH